MRLLGVLGVLILSLYFLSVNVNMKMQKSSNMKMHKYFIVLCGKNTGYYFY